MPLKHGTSSSVVSGNIKEMMRAGHKQPQAIAAALSMKRKSKKMAEGGLVEAPDFDMNDMQDEQRDLGDIAEMGKFESNEIANPETQSIERMFAKKLFDESEKREGYAVGGLVEPESGNETPAPEVDGTEEPMSDEETPVVPSALSEEALRALLAKKTARKLMV